MFREIQYSSSGPWTPKLIHSGWMLRLTLLYIWKPSKMGYIWSRKRPTNIFSEWFNLAINQSINQCLLLKQQPIGFSKRVRLFKQSHCVSNKNRLGETNITENSKYIQQRHRGKCGTRTETGTAQTSPTSTTTQSKGTTPPRTQAGALHNCAAQLSSC